jgi:hypothetical protein
MMNTRMSPTKFVPLAILFAAVAMGWGMSLSSEAWAVSGSLRPIHYGLGPVTAPIDGTPELLAEPMTVRDISLHARRGRRGLKSEHGIPGHASLPSGELHAKRGGEKPEKPEKPERLG